MSLPPLPEEWEQTRTTLQAYSKALTAIPRAAAVADDRWTHVAMHIGDDGLTTAPTPLSDGTSLVGSIDLVDHRILVSSGGDTEAISIEPGPSSVSIGDLMLAVASRHGTEIAVDRDRFGTLDGLRYDPAQAEQFFAAALFVRDAFEEMNKSVGGEVTGPHLWPHGFDIATEWYSERTFPLGDTTAPGQIAVGFYPAGESYFYANPWPFADEWSRQPPTETATWHLDGWQGAVLEPGGVEMSDIVDFGLAVHALAIDSLA